MASTNIRDPDADDRSPYHIDIFLNEKIYNPGDTIQGEVIFRLDKNLFCDMISVQLFGFARVFWTDNGQTGDSSTIRHGYPNGSGCFHTVAHEQKKILLDETTMLWSKAKKNHKKRTQPTLDDIVRMASSTAIRARKPDNDGSFEGLEIGKHKFEFTFRLPKQGLYTSFDLKDCGGRVQYHINVQCFSCDRLVLRKKLIFPIVRLTDPVDCLAALTGNSKKTKVEFAKGQYLEVELSTTKNYFVPGEALPVQIYIDNKSGKSVKYSHLSIQQHVFGIATYPITAGKEWYQDTAGVGLDVHKVPTAKIHKYAPKFNVPALVPDFEIDGCLSLNYALKLDVGFERSTTKSSSKLIACSLTIPISIGTNSLTDENLIQKPKLQEAIESPPNYNDIPPPSYESIFKPHISKETNSNYPTASLSEFATNGSDIFDKKNV